jgi:DNA-directed RNA polymerase subunit RPC12/RpoP
LGRPLLSESLYVHDGISLSPDRKALVWELDAHHVNVVKPTPRMIESFLALDRASPEAVARFAKKWGVFDFMKLRSGFPVGLSFQLEGARWVLYSRYLAVAPPTREPLQLWQTVVSDFRAALNVAARLRLGLRPSSEDTSRLEAAHICSEGAVPLRKWCADSTAWARFLLDVQIQIWSSGGRVGLILRPTGDLSVPGWSVRASFHGLFGALALQLMLIVAEADSLYCCSGCGRPYLRSSKKRRPRLDGNNYCALCGRKRAVRDAKERQRRKKAEARRLHAEGVSTKEIAARLNTREEHVQRWVGGR